MEATIREAIQTALKELGIGDVDFVVEHPGDLVHGDYASNVAMVLYKTITTQMKKADSEYMGSTLDLYYLKEGEPRSLKQFAELLAEKLKGQIEFVEKIEVAGPGFINFHLKREFYAQKLNDARKPGGAWGKNDRQKNQNVFVEFTDPNPFKEFHIGHLMTNTIGESISRLLEMAGANVRRVNYQGDVGMHVAKAIWGLQKLKLSPNKIDIKLLGQAYAQGAVAYEEEEDTREVIRKLNKAIYERSENEITELYDKGVLVSLKYFEQVYESLGMTPVTDDNEGKAHFNSYFYESHVWKKGRDIVLNNLERGIFKQSDGAIVFKGEEYNLHTRVFINSEGLPTYEAKELGLLKEKYERSLELELLGKRPPDQSLVITANEIKEYFKVVLQAAKVIGGELKELANKTEHIPHGLMRLKEGKMSSRTGGIITAESFINDVQIAAEDKIRESGRAGDSNTSHDVAIGAIKYSILKNRISQDILFDKEQALSFEGDSGPYLQYTHARICSVLEKAGQAGVEASTQLAPPEPYEIEKLLYRFPEVIRESLSERAPHKVTTFLTELAGAFNTFYAHEIIADPNDEYAPYKAALADAVRQTLANGLWVLGIKAPQSM